MFEKINQNKFASAAFVQTLICLFFIVSAFAQNSKRTEIFRLGETKVKINVYEKRGSAITFVALHHNEQLSIKVAKEMIAKKGGRLIELESFDEAGKPSRRLKFEFEKAFYTIDPNRIFTQNGRICDYSPIVVPVIKAFADKLLKLVLAPNNKRLRKGEKFIVALHNNQNIDDPGRSESEKENDLTALSFINGGSVQHPLIGRYAAQAAGVFVSNIEPDEDNFIFVSEPNYLDFFADKGFHVVLQKPAEKLKTADCAINDGSLSIYFGQRGLPYINLEADRDNGAERQTQMLTAIYELIKK